jgi:hypothetical protein
MAREGMAQFTFVALSGTWIGPHVVGSGSGVSLVETLALMMQFRKLRGRQKAMEWWVRATMLHTRIKMKNRQEATSNCRNVWETWVVGQNYR